MTIETTTTPKRRARSGVMMLLILIACAAVCLWAWRNALDDNPVPKLLKAMSSGREAERINAMESIWPSPPEQSRVATPTLLDALRDPSPTIRAQAAKSLGHIYKM